MVEITYELLEDMGGYILWAIDQDIPYQDIVFTLANDISAAIKREDVLPKTGGYKQYLPKYKDA